MLRPVAAKAPVGETPRGGAGWAWVIVTAWAVALFFPTEASLRGGLGMPWVLLWLGLASVACLRRAAAIQQPGGSTARLRWHWVDGVWLFFFAWYSLSVGIGIFRGTLEVRPAVGSLWQQLGIAAVYVTARVSTMDGRLPRLLPQAIVGFSLTLAFFAWYQYGVLLPDMHRQYQESTEPQKIELLVAAGVTEAEPGSRMRELFESRLFNREPFATFTLANTLAIVLTPGVLLAFIASISCWLERRWREAASWLLAWLVLSSSLATTSSRTAVLSVVSVSGLWLIVHWVSRGRGAEGDQEPERATPGRLRWRVPGWGLAGLGLLVLLPLLTVVALWSAGASDSQLLASAPSSVQYRLQYWFASAEMIAARPWYGWGPGNFQSSYARFQAVEASETVADPHNFFFELAATAGLPAGLSFLLAVGGALGLGLWGRRGGVAATSPTGEWAIDGRATLPVAQSWLAEAGLPLGCLVTAMGLGLAIAWLGESVPGPLPILLGCGLLAAAWWSGQQATTRGRSADGGLVVGLQTSDWAPWVLGGLLLNLLAAGGVSYPAIAQCLSLISGLIVGAVGGSLATEGLRSGAKISAVGRPARPWPWWMASWIILGSMIYAYAWHTLPVIRSDWAVQRARGYAQANNSGARQRELRSAVALDPHNAEAQVELAIHHLVDQFRELDSPAVWAKVHQQLQAAAARRPNSSPTRLRIAEVLLQAAGQANHSRLLKGRLLAETRVWLEEGLERKPVDSRVLAQLSWLAFALQDLASARAFAEQALRIAERNPHADLQLQRQWFSATSVDLPATEAISVRRVEAMSTLVQVNAGDWTAWLLAADVTAK
jgi:hypothetical protein